MKSKRPVQKLNFKDVNPEGTGQALLDNVTKTIKASGFDKAVFENRPQNFSKTVCPM